jgi:hypothetical protein
LRANNKNDFQQKLQQLLVDNTYADRNTAIAKKDIEKFNSDLMLEKWEALFST